jgi:hypothetical protein
MCKSSLTRAFLALSLTLAACGGDRGGMTGPPEEEGPGPGPGDPGPGENTGPAPVGTVMYAVDLANNFLVFGSGSIGTLTAKIRISGVPLLKRIIGLAVRPSDGALIGVGNDSRVYTINPLTAKATAINPTPFSPGISSIFDVHFAMALEPNGTRVRLISAESGANWSIDIHTGMAIKGKPARYGAGQPFSGRTPRLLGLVYAALPDSARGPGWCPNLAYSADADEAIVLASCDPDSGYWYQTGRMPSGSSPVQTASTASTSAPYDREWEELKDQLLRCGEWMHNVTAREYDGEKQPSTEGGPWFPRSPDTEFYVFLVEVGNKQNRSGTVKLIDGQKWGLTLGPVIPSEEPVQSVVFDKGGPYGPSNSVSGDWRPLSAKLENQKLDGGNPSHGPTFECSNPPGTEN